ncbi:MAG: prepilin-type N-terminal cleavage/methylation domain-containing protein [Candidatus Omnitrophica bacterium]|nr:prepilin-type N-terminal cleavage/methylation domain-containing protein [Candidatus Omnitrophota bacterium]
MRFHKKGFTLIELIVVVVIVAILAGIAGPMMTANVSKAKRSEAAAALGLIRTAERLYYTENPATGYVSVADFNLATNPLAAYIGTGDLKGQYYNVADYHVNAASATTFTGYANKTDPGNMTIDQDGSITGR